MSTIPEKQPFASGSSKTSFDLEPNPFEQSFAHKDEKQPVIGSTSSPPILTPGGRKLPPLVLSPNVPSSWGATQFPRTGLTPNESSMRTGLTPGGANYPHSLNNLGLSGLNTPGGSMGFPGFTPGLSSLLGTNTKEFDQQAQKNATTATNAVVGATAEVRNKPPIMKEEDKKPVKPENGKHDIPNNGKRKTKSEEEDSKKKTKKSKNETKVQEFDEDDPNMTEEDKRRSFLERNRVAASKCRQRKKQQIQKMETDLNFYLNEYNNLTGTIDSLKEQALILRNLVSTKSMAPDVITSVDNILMIIDQTNYISRLRGDNPSNIVPTVQPVNPTMVQQSQQRAAVAAMSTIPPPPQVSTIPVQTQQIMIPPQTTQQMPMTVGNSENGKMMLEWNN